jgi:hypothetical protein
MGLVLSSPVAKNIFLSFPEQKRYDFIRNTHSLFIDDPFLNHTRLALSLKPYAPYLLVQLIERDAFKKMTDYTSYLNCINSVTTSELEELSSIPRNEEVFMNFMRYIGLLDVSDHRKVEG